MTVVDTSGVIDLLLGSGAAIGVQALLERERVIQAPDLLVFEVLAVLRRETARGQITPPRAAAAVTTLGDVSLALFPTLWLRGQAWALRENFRMADALFIALAEQLEEPFATKDKPLAKAAAEYSRAEVVVLQ